MSLSFGLTSLLGSIDLGLFGLFVLALGFEDGVRFTGDTLSVTLALTRKFLVVRSRVAWVGDELVEETGNESGGSGQGCDETMLRQNVHLRSFEVTNSNVDLGQCSTIRGELEEDLGALLLDDGDVEDNREVVRLQLSCLRAGAITEGVQVSSESRANRSLRSCTHHLSRLKRILQVAEAAILDALVIPRTSEVQQSRDTLAIKVALGRHLVL